MCRGDHWSPAWKWRKKGRRGAVPYGKNVQNKGKYSKYYQVVEIFVGATIGRPLGNSYGLSESRGRRLDIPSEIDNR